MSPFVSYRLFSRILSTYQHLGLETKVIIHPIVLSLITTVRFKREKHIPLLLFSSLHSISLLFSLFSSLLFTSLLLFSSFIFSPGSYLLPGLLAIPLHSCRLCSLCSAYRRRYCRNDTAFTSASHHARMRAPSERTRNRRNGRISAEICRG
jgi:hypothetical protein